MLRDLKDLSSFCEHFIFLSCLAEVATGNLLDLAEGAPTALVHSGKMQKTPDPFTARNHATENNNTVWVRHGPVFHLDKGSGPDVPAPLTKTFVCFVSGDGGRAGRGVLEVRSDAVLFWEEPE